MKGQTHARGIREANQKLNKEEVRRKQKRSSGVAKQICSGWKQGAEKN